MIIREKVKVGKTYLREDYKNMPCAEFDVVFLFDGDTTTKEFNIDCVNVHEADPEYFSDLTPEQLYKNITTPETSYTRPNDLATIEKEATKQVKKTVEEKEIEGKYKGTAYVEAETSRMSLSGGLTIFKPIRISFSRL